MARTCNFGANDDGQKKLDEMANFFNCTVEAQTGKVWGGGAVESGSRTVRGQPNVTGTSHPPPSPCTPKKTGRKAIKEQRKALRKLPRRQRPDVYDSLEHMTLPAPFPDPCNPDDVTSQVVAVQFDPLFVPNAPMLLDEPSLLQRLLESVDTEQVFASTGLGAADMAYATFVTADGRSLRYRVVGDFEYLEPTHGVALARQLDCEGLAMLRLLTWHPAPQALLALPAEIQPARLVHELIGASRQAEQDETARAAARIESLIGRVQDLAADYMSEFSGSEPDMPPDDRTDPPQQLFMRAIRALRLLRQHVLTDVRSRPTYLL